MIIRIFILIMMMELIPMPLLVSELPPPFSLPGCQAARTFVLSVYKFKHCQHHEKKETKRKFLLVEKKCEAHRPPPPLLLALPPLLPPLHLLLLTLPHPLCFCILPEKFNSTLIHIILPDGGNYFLKLLFSYLGDLTFR